MININDPNQKNIKTDKKSGRDILIYNIGYETHDGVKPLYINFNNINRYIEDKNDSKYLPLIILIDENKREIKK